MIVCKDEVSAGSLKANEEDVRAILERETKKQISFEIYGPAKGEDSEAKYPDLESKINFDIEIKEQ